MVPLVSQMYPDDSSGSLWNSIQNGLVRSRQNGDNCNVDNNLKCEYLDQIKSLFLQQNDSQSDDEDSNEILENYVGNSIETNLVHSLLKSLL
jgi:uncharacterized protein YpuA (DUF1002 family)